MTKRTDLPAPSAPNYATRVRETIMTYLGRTGDPLDQGITLRDLVENGFVDNTGRWRRKGGGELPLEPGPAVPPPYEVDLTPPPTPSGVYVSAGLDFVFLRTAQPLFRMGNGYLRTRVYGVQWPDDIETAPVFPDAQLIHDFEGEVGSFTSNPDTRWAIWLTWQTRDGVESVTPAGGANGFVVRTGQDVNKLFDALTRAALDPNAPYSQIIFRANLFTIASEPSDTSPEPIIPFIVNTTEIVENGVTIPPGVYMDGAYVRNLNAAIARLGEAWISSAMVNDLAATKITAGALQVGSYISSSTYSAGTSGWRINADGSAEFNNVTVRGAVYASSGVIGGITIASLAVRAGQTAFNAGEGFYLGGDGRFSVGNSEGNRMVWDGTSLYIQGTLAATAGTIGGITIAAASVRAGQTALNTGTGFFLGADGTLSLGSPAGPRLVWDGTSLNIRGVLTADAVNAVDTVNIAGSAVSVPATAWVENNGIVQSPAIIVPDIGGIHLPILVVGSFILGEGNHNKTCRLTLQDVFVVGPSGETLLQQAGPLFYGVGHCLTGVTWRPPGQYYARGYIEDVATGGSNYSSMSIIALLAKR